MSAWQGHSYTDTVPCGTTAAYRRHLRHGETPCRSCKGANARAVTDSRADRRDPGPRRERYQMLREAGISRPVAEKLKDMRPERWPAHVAARLGISIPQPERSAA